MIKPSKREPITVILTCAGSPVIPAIVRLLKRSEGFDVSVVGIDKRPKSEGVGGFFCDEFFQVPGGEDDEYFSLVEDLLAKKMVQIIFPSSDEEALTLSREREKLLQMDCDVACPSFPSIELTLSKPSLYHHLEDNDIPVCRFRTFSSFYDLRETAAEFGYPKNPLVLKPSVGRGSDGLFILDRSSSSNFFPEIDLRSRRVTLEGFERLWGDDDYAGREYIVMEFMPGDKYSCDVLVEKGKPQLMITRNNGPSPKVRPPTVSASLAVVQDVEDYARKICENIEFDFFVQIEIGRRKDGTLGLIEINPRLDASLSSTSVSGVNFYEEMLQYRRQGTFRRLDRQKLLNLQAVDYRRYWSEVFLLDGVQIN